MRLPLAALIALTPLVSAQLKVMTSGGFGATLRDVVPEFEKTTGIQVALGGGASQGDGPMAIGAQLRRGVQADVVIMSREGLNDLIAESRIAKGSGMDLARTPLGVSVRSGAQKPDLSTVDGFKQALLRARSVTFPSSTTGIYMMTKLFPELGIDKELSGKITHDGIAAVARGDADIAIQPVSELLHASGADFVGTIPEEIQYISVFSAAIVAGSNHTASGARLIEFLRSEPSRAAMKQHGMEPVK